MKRVSLLALVLACLGCDRGPGAAAPGQIPPSDEKAAEAAWNLWRTRLSAGDGKGAWECLSKRTRSERAALYRADASRIRGLSGAALEAEARSWGTSAQAIQQAGAEELAVLALARLGADGAPESSAVTVSGEVARVRLAGKHERWAVLVREEGTWRLDDLESRRAAGR